MGEIRDYLFSVVTAALIGGILCAIVHETAAKDLIQFLCGICLAVAVLLPLTSLDTETLFSYDKIRNSYPAEPTRNGEEIAQQAMAAIIKEKTEAYICDKAQQMEISVQADILLNESLQPCRAQIDGNYSPQERELLSAILEADLGIPKEDQQWIG